MRNLRNWSGHSIFWNGENGEKSLSCVRPFATPWTVAHQAPLSMGFSRQEYWSGLPFPSPGNLPNPGTEPRSPALQADALTSEPPGKSISPNILIGSHCYEYLLYRNSNLSFSYFRWSPLCKYVSRSTEWLSWTNLCMRQKSLSIWKNG